MWRDASSSTTVTGSRLIQTAWIDPATGRISSFTDDGNDKVEKYWKADTTEILYKKILPPLLFLPGNTSSFTFDGSGFTEVSHSSLDTAFRAAVIFKGKYYVIDSLNNIKVSTDLTSWTDTGEDGLTLASNGDYMCATYTSGTTIRYTSDGSSWSTWNSWSSSPAPHTINSVRWLNSQWVACGVCDDTMGSGYLKPWTAYCNTSDPGVYWDDYALTTSGDGDTSFLDIAYENGGYTAYAYVGMNANYINVYTSQFLNSWSQYGSYYSNVNGSYSDRRYNISYENSIVATPNGKMVSPMAGYEYFKNGTSTEATWACYPAGQDSNGVAWTLTYDNTSPTTVFTLVGSNGQSYEVPGAAYCVGGST